MKHKLPYCLIACLLISQALLGVPYSTGNGAYVVDVEVRNSVMNLLPNPSVQCRMSGEKIFVKASATGYKTSSTSITPTGSTGFFKRDLVLADPETRFVGVDMNEEPLESVYFQKDQYGIDPLMFGVTAYIPVSQWASATSKGVALYDRQIGFILRTECKIEKIEEYYQVRMTISRNALEMTSRDYAAVFNTKRAIEPGVSERWLKRLASLEQKDLPFIKDSYQTFTMFLFNNLPLRSLQLSSRWGVNPDKAIQTLYSEAENFSRLHRDFEE